MLAEKNRNSNWLGGQSHENFEHAGQLAHLPKHRFGKSCGEFYLSGNREFSSHSLDISNDSIVTCVGTVNH
jgi:hypothetical protein